MTDLVRAVGLDLACSFWEFRAKVMENLNDLAAKLGVQRLPCALRDDERAAIARGEAYLVQGRISRMWAEVADAYGSTGYVVVLVYDPGTKAWRSEARRKGDHGARSSGFSVGRTPREALEASTRLLLYSLDAER